MKKYYLLFVLLFNLCLFSQENKQIITDYLNSNKKGLGLSNDDIKNWIETDISYSKKSQVTHVYIRQQYQGIHIYTALATFNIKDNKILSFGNTLEKNISKRINTTQPIILPFDAIVSAAKQLDLGKPSNLKIVEAESTSKFFFNKANISLEDIPVQLMFIPIENGEIRLVWDLSIYTLDQKHWWSVRVDALSGEIIDKVDWVVSCNFGTCNHTEHQIKEKKEKISVKEFHSIPSLLLPPSTDQYRVFPIPVESPNHGADALVVGPADPVASPFGWHDTNGVDGAEYTITRGNNVYAQEDTNGNNGFGAAPNGGASLNFDFPMNLNQQPSGYQNAAITNLFYMNNIMHDVWYQYGFDEASGNFQTNNYGRGGTAGDAVTADAQDGSGTNNANFATPADGGTPRMQMFLWSAPTSSPVDKLTINTPSGISGSYNAIPAGFGGAIPTTPLTSDLVLVVDDTAPTDDACNAIVNAAALNGKIAVIRRGTCSFVIKVKAAQDAGALAVIMVNNVAGNPIVMGGTDATITIPSVMISDIDGAAIINALLANEVVNGTLLDVPVSGFQLDGDLDNGIVAHEYGHGISTRLTGGRTNSNCLSNAEQMGEGWSDWFALMLTIEPGDQGTDSRGIGTYAIGESTSGGGIRPQPYSTNSAINNVTYAITNNTASIAQPHGIGFVWCSFLWDMSWALIDKYGYDPDVYNGKGGNNIAMHLVIEGLKLQPCSPGFVDGRNAILAADQALYGGENQCLIWDIFAARGLGQSASQGNSTSRTDQVEAFDIPALYLLPEINVQGNTLDIADGDLIPTNADDSDFGVVTSATESRTFTIFNKNCQSPLTVNSITFSGVDATEFSIANVSFPLVIPTDGSATFDIVFNPESIGEKNAIVTIDNNDADESNYDFAVKATYNCGVETTTWDGSLWSNGVPTKIKAAIFSGDYTSSSNLEACSLLVTNNAQVTISVGNTFVITKDVTIDSGSTFTIENNAALRQIEDTAVNTGDIQVKKNSSPIVRLDYTAWAAPVIGQQLKSFSPSTVDSRFYEYLYTGTTTPTAYQTVDNLSNFVPGKGYIIRAPNNWSATTSSAYNGAFTGVATNGIVTQNVGLGYNVIGNPYASPLDADSFLAANPNVGALYFWTHTAPASGGSYPVNNFASYTTLGGTASAAGGATPNGIIQTGQGFYVQVTTAGSVNFNNAQRLDASTSTQFFRSNSNATNIIDKHRIWLNLDSSTERYNQILIGYMSGATNGFDNLIDGKVLDVSKTMIYNVLNNEPYVIQGKELPFSYDDVVPLGLKITEAGTFMISLDHIDGLFDNQAIFIKDNMYGIIHDLKASPYSFTAQQGTSDDRFEIVYQNFLLSSNDFSNEDGLHLFATNQTVSVSSLQLNISEIEIYDIVGRLIYSKKKIMETTFNTNRLEATNQALIVKVTLEDGAIISKKIILD